MENKEPNRPKFELLQGGGEAETSLLQRVREAATVRKNLRDEEENRLAELLRETRLRPTEVVDESDE